jgi:hypothetical protein
MVVLMLVMVVLKLCESQSEYRERGRNVREDLHECRGSTRREMCLRYQPLPYQCEKYQNRVSCWVKLCSAGYNSVVGARVSD